MARNFTGRLNRLNPTAVPDQESGMKWTAIVMRAIVTVFLSVAFIGNCWQLWVGVLLFSLPSIINEFQDRFPSKPKINRYIPQQTPTLTIVEICIVGTLSIFACDDWSWAFYDPDGLHAFCHTANWACYYECYWQGNG